MLRRSLTSSWPAVVVAGLGIVLVLLRADVPAESAVRYAAYLAGIALPGVFTWRLLLQRLHTQAEQFSGQVGRRAGDRPRTPTWFEDISLGTIFGFGLQLPFFLAGVAVGVDQLVLVPPALAVILSVATPFGRRVWQLPTRSLDVRASWALSALVVYGVAWLGREQFVVQPLSRPTYRPASIDETFHQALISDLAHRFPPQKPFLLDTPLDYHWFVHAQIAASNTTTGLDSVTMLRVMVPTLVLVLAIVGLAAVALRLTGRPVAAVIAPTLLVAGAYQLMGPAFRTDLFLEPYLTRRFISSPSQSYGVMMALPAIMLILEMLRPSGPSRQGAQGPLSPLSRRSGWPVWLALALALLMLSGSKATFMPIFLCGAVAAWVITLVLTRRLPRVATGLVLLVVAVTVFAQVVIFGGDTGSLSFDPFKTVTSAVRGQGLPLTDQNYVLMTGVMLTGWLLYGIGLIGLGRTLLDPRAVWLVVSIAAGITVPFLFFRTGSAQLWFSRTTAEMIVLVSAWGMARLLPNPLPLRKAAGLLVLAAAVGCGAFAVSRAVAQAQGTSQSTPESMLLTVAVPVLVLVLWLLVRLIAGLLPSRPQIGLVVPLTVLLALSTVNMAAFSYYVVTDQQSPRIAAANPRGATLFAPGGAEAARFIAQHSPVEDIVATNVHCANPDAKQCDNRSFWVAAYSERRVVVEGWGYTAVTNARHAEASRNAYVPMPYPRRLAVNDAAFTTPTRESLDRLVSTYGVDWLFVSQRYPVSLLGLEALAGQGLLTKEYQNDSYVVFKVAQDDES